jgi:Cu-Zn family superoxide dismutase
MKAISQIFSSDYKKVHGFINIVEDENTLTHFIIDLYDLKPGKHGFHIHEKGDPFACCNNLGGHYNPFLEQHSDRLNDKRHVGDLGNILVDDSGKCFMTFTDNLVKLKGLYSIIGRSFVIHEDADDLGLGSNNDSLITGNSGKRVAFGIIGIA